MLLLLSLRKLRTILFRDFFATQTIAARTMAMATLTNTSKAADTEAATVTSEELLGSVEASVEVVARTV